MARRVRERADVFLGAELPCPAEHLGAEGSRESPAGVRGVRAHGLEQHRVAALVQPPQRVRHQVAVGADGDQIQLGAVGRCGGDDAVLVDRVARSGLVPRDLQAELAQRTTP